MEDETRRVEQVHAGLLGDLCPGAKRAQSAEMPRPAVEIDDKNGSPKGFGVPQQPDARVGSEIIEDQAAPPLFTIFRNHDASADITSANRLTASEPSLLRP